MNRRKFLAASASLTALPLVAAVPLAAATEKADGPQPTFQPAGIYSSKDNAGPFMVVVQEAVLAGGYSFRGLWTAIQGVNAKPFLGHARGTVLLLSGNITKQTGMSYDLVRYEFALTSEGWNERMGNVVSATGQTLYPYVDYDALPWGPTPAEWHKDRGGEPISWKVKPTGMGV